MFFICRKVKYILQKPTLKIKQSSIQSTNFSKSSKGEAQTNKIMVGVTDQ
jgi:hypothetical protein